MKKLSSLMFLFATGVGYAGVMGQAISEPRAYLSVFGGGGSLSSLSLTQLGTAFYSDTKGGPLAVNAFGQSNSLAEWMVGGSAGYYFSESPMLFGSLWSLRPATELEGYYLGQQNLKGEDVNNETTRLTEHDFLLSYPMSVGVGLVNAMASFHHEKYARWHPYVAGGIGVAAVSISNATSSQMTPLEAGINHYNSDRSDSTSTFATQAKAGLHFDWTEHVALFAEYRYLYLAGTNYTFGSAVYPQHPATSEWNVKFGSQSYNMGVIGMRYLF